MEAPLAPGRILDLLPVAVLVVDPDGRLALVNRRAESILRLAPGSLGRPCAEALPHPVAAAIEGMIAEAAATGRAPERPLAPGTVPGVQDPIALDLAVLPEGAGSVATLREAPAGRAAAAPPAQMTSKLGHDLKTPLTSIKAYTEALTEMATEPQVRDFLKVIDEETDRLVAMINAMVRAWREQNP